MVNPWILVLVGVAPQQGCWGAVAVVNPCARDGLEFITVASVWVDKLGLGPLKGSDGFMCKAHLVLIDVNRDAISWMPRTPVWWYVVA